MTTGIKDLDRFILEKLDDRDLLSMCSTNRYFKKLCKDDEFWRRRYFSRFGKHAEHTKYFEEDEREDWKRKYLSTVIDLEEFVENKFNFFDQISFNMKNFDKSYYYGKRYTVPILLAPKRILNNLYLLNLGNKIVIYTSENEEKKIYTDEYITPYTLYQFIKKNFNVEGLTLFGLQEYKDGYRAIFVS